MSETRGEQPEQLKQIPEQIDLVSQQSETEKKKARLVSVEEIIPDIKPFSDEEAQKIKKEFPHSSADFMGPSFISKLLEGVNSDLQYKRGELNHLKTYELIKKHFKNQIVVDLGAGLGEAYDLLVLWFGLWDYKLYSRALVHRSISLCNK